MPRAFGPVVNGSRPADFPELGVHLELIRNGCVFDRQACSGEEFIGKPHGYVAQVFGCSCVDEEVELVIAAFE